MGLCLLPCVGLSVGLLRRAELEILAEIPFFTGRHIFGLGFPASVVGVFIVEFAIPTAVEITAAVRALVLPGHLSIEGQFFLTMKTDVRHGLLLSGRAHPIDTIRIIDA